MLAGDFFPDFGIGRGHQRVAVGFKVHLGQLECGGVGKEELEYFSAADHGGTILTGRFEGLVG